MKVKVNGELRDFTEPLTVKRLLEQLNLKPPGVAVAINRTLVPRTQHATTPVREDDAVEIIHAVGGG